MKQNSYGKHSLLQNRNFIIFMLSNFSQIAYSGIFSVVIINLIIVDKTGLTASYTTIYSVLGASIAGVFGSFILLNFKKHSIGIFCSMISLIISSSLLFTSHDSLWVYVLVISVLSAINSLELPNTNATLPLFINRDQISVAFSIYQMILQSLKLIVPVIVNFFIRIIPIEQLIFSFSLLYIVSTVPWIVLRKEITSSLAVKENDLDTEPNKAYKSLISGYKELFKNKNILKLNLFRVSNNLVYSICATAFPIIIGSIAVTKIDITNLDTISDVLIAVSFIIIGIVLSKGFLKKFSNIRVLAYVTPGLALLGFLIFYILQNNIGFYILSVFIGMGLYAGRISVITIGQTITPQKLLSVSILAGDTVTKISTLIASFIFLQVIQINGISVYNTLFILLLIGNSGVYFIISPAKEFIEKSNEEQ